MMKLFTPALWLLIGLGIAGTGYAQTPEPTRPTAQTQPAFSCGQELVQKHLMETDASYRNFVLNAKAVRLEKKQTRPGGREAAVSANDPILTIPVVFVVYHLGEAVGQGSNVSDADLQAQVALMNRQYAAAHPAYRDGNTTDSRIQFAMARRKVDCSAFNGVVRIDGRSVKGYAAVGVDYNDGDRQAQFGTLADASVAQMRQQAVVINVYWQVTGGVSGWASFGGQIWVGAGPMTYSDPYNDLLAHEMGHVLFLNHTFQGGDDNVNCPPNANPFLDGDQVPDTDPHLKYQPACSSAAESAINACTNRPFGKIGRNIMSYGCQTYIFTPGQIDRMRGYLNGSLSRLVNSPYLLPPPPAGVSTVACLPTSPISATNAYQSEGIRSVNLSQINSTTDLYGYTPVLYQDLSCLQQTAVQRGQSYTITIDAPNNTSHRRVYLDLNNDGLFDETTERLFSTSIGDEQGVLTIPTTALTGQTLRMRVVVCDGLVPPTACYVPTYGAVQDFGVLVEPAGQPPQLVLSQLNSLSYCAGLLYPAKNGKENGKIGFL